MAVTQLEDPVARTVRGWLQNRDELKAARARDFWMKGEATLPLAFAAASLNRRTAWLLWRRYLRPSRQARPHRLRVAARCVSLHVT